MILLLAGIAPALATSVTVCVDFTLDFDDAAWGDAWTDNSPRNARGVAIRWIDDNGNLDDNLGPNGCKTHNVDVDVDGKFNFRVISTATVNGVDIAAHHSDEWSSKPLTFVQWNNLTATDSPFALELPSTVNWEALAIATRIFNLSDFHIDDGPSRACCDEEDPSYQADGTCGDVPEPGMAYEPIGGTVHLFTDTGACGGSTMLHDPANENSFRHPALAVGDGCHNKWVISHELGHVIVGMRMGGRENVRLEAPLDGCMADFENMAATIEVDPGGDARGTFTKEYMAAALREGWADFIAGATFNARGADGCIVQTSGMHDFDLDGTIDQADGQYDCSGTPYVGADPYPPVIYMDGSDWLKSVEDGTAVCDPHSQFEGNRSTVADVASMWWSVYDDTITPIDLEVLADVHVDMCPKFWAQTDECQDDDDDDLPYHRLLAAADANGLFGLFNSAGGGHILHDGPECDVGP